MVKRILSMFLATAMIFSMLPSTVFAATGEGGVHVCDDPGSYCLVCDLAGKINELPAADDITIDNAAAVTEKIHAIDRIKTKLGDSEYDELLTLVVSGPNGSGYGLDVPTAYMTAVAKIKSLTNTGVTLYPVKKFIADGTVDVENAIVQLKLTNVSAGTEQILTMSTMYVAPAMLNEPTEGYSEFQYAGLSQSSDFYSPNAEGNGWKFGYTIPAGTYTIEEIDDEGATVNGSAFVTTSTTYSVNDGEAESGKTATFTVTEGGNTVIVFENAFDPETGAHTHPVCGNTDCSEKHDLETECELSDVTYTALSGALEYDAATNTYSGSLSVGSYYLDKDITLSAELKITADINLCLNGFKLALADSAKEGNSVLHPTGGTLNICDCSDPDEGSIENGYGQASSSYTSGAGMYIDSGATVNMYGGYIRNNRNAEYGRGVYIGGVSNIGGTFNLYGGSISDKASMVLYVGSSSGTLKIYGGTVSGSTLADHYNSTYVANGNAYIYGGTIDRVYFSEAKTAVLGGSPKIGRIDLFKCALYVDQSLAIEGKISVEERSTYDAPSGRNGKITSVKFMVFDANDSSTIDTYFNLEDGAKYRIISDDTTESGKTTYWLSLYDITTAEMYAGVESFSVNERVYSSGTNQYFEVVAAAGAKDVYVGVTPSSGCVVKSVSAVYEDENGSTQKITADKDNATGYYKFTMPAANVKIEVETAYEVTAGITSINGDEDETYNGDNFDVYLYVYDEDTYEEDIFTQTIKNGEVTFTIPMANYNIDYAYIKIDNLGGKGYYAKLGDLDLTGTGKYNFAIDLYSVDKIELAVTDTEHIHDSNAKSITIESISPADLTDGDFRIDYYEINENTGEIIWLDPDCEQAPKAVGKYLYVISYIGGEDGEDAPEYVFANPYVDSENAGDLYYPIDGPMPLPSDTVTYDNAGIMLIEAPGKDIGEMSFTTPYIEAHYSNNIENTLETDKLVEGAVVTYKSSDENVIKVDADGKITKTGNATGVVTITATASLEGYASESATYVINLKPDEVVVTISDMEIEYGKELDKNEITVTVTKNGVISTPDSSTISAIKDNLYTTYVSGSKVGTYDLTSSLTPSAVTNNIVVSGKLTVTPKILTADDFLVSAENKTYDGKTDAVVSASVKDDSLVNTGDVVKVIAEGSFENANAASGKTVNVNITDLSGADAGNYKISAPVVVAAAADINKATVTVTVLGNTTFVYDGTTKALVFLAQAGNEIFNPSNYTVSYNDGDGLPVDLPTNVGEYTPVLTLTDEAAKNYTLTSPVVKLIIDPDDGDFMVYKPDTPIYYGDKDKTIEVVSDSYTVKYEVTDGTGVVTVNEDGELTIIGVGDVTVKVTGTKANYIDEVQTISFKVLPRPVTASVAVAGREYNGTAVMEDVTVSLNDYTRENVTEVGATYTGASTSNAGVGNHTVTVSGLKLTGDKADCYVLTATEAYAHNVAITKKTLEISIDAKDKVYDTTKSADVTVTLEGVINGEEDFVSVFGTAEFDTETAGENKTVTYTAIGLTGDKSGNYILESDTAIDTAEITPAPVTFTFGTTKFRYDGNLKTVQINAVTDKGLAFAEYTVTYGGEESRTDVGVYDIEITIADTNHKIADGTTLPQLEIIAADQGELTVIGLPETLYYGRIFTLETVGGDGVGAVTWQSSDENIAKVNENGVVTITGVGNVKITATKASDANYNATDADIEFTTTKRDVTFTIENLEQVFDSDPKTVTVSSPVEGATYEVKYAGEKLTDGNAINAGEYTVTVEATGNYSGSATATLIIKKATLYVTGFDVADTTYGDAAEVTIPELPDGVSYDLIYIVNGEQTAVQPKNASEAKYYAMLVLTGDNYETKTIDDNFKIDKATLTATAKDAKRAYGTNNPEFEVTYSGFKYQDNESVILTAATASTTATPNSSVGDYDIIVSGGTADNYTFNYVYGILKITDSDDAGNKYIPDQDGDDKPEVDDDGDGIYDGTKDEDNDGNPDNTYIPDQDSDGKPEVDDDGDGIYDGTKDDDKYIPDQDNDGDPEKVVDNGDGTYTEDKDGDGNADADGDTYIPDQDNDGDPEKVVDNGDGTYTEDKDGDGNADADGDTYIPDQDNDGDPEKVVDNGDGTYTEDKDGDGNADTDGDTYIPDQDNDGDPEKVTDDNNDGIYEDENGNEYKPDGNGNLDPHVATPVISPNGGTFISSQTVTITTTTDGAVIYYTTDGTDPSATNGTAYTGVIPVSDTTTVKAIAVKGETVSGIAEATFTKEIPVIPMPSYYDITVNPSVNGTVTANRTSELSGSTIILTVNPDSGYKLSTLTVADRYDNEITVTAINDTTYMFRMPSREVWVTATFTKAAGTPDVPSVHDCPSKAFSDVNTDLWYHEAIDFVLWNKYMNGMGNGQFQPDTVLSRAMMVQVLYNMENRPGYKTVSSFEDVKSDEWFYDAVNWAAENGIVKGYSDTVFGPNEPLTREQMAAILYRYADYKGIDVTARGDLSIFNDGDKTSSWALDEVRWTVKVGLVIGKGNGVLDPTGTATRAEVAQILMNYCKKILGE